MNSGGSGAWRSRGRREAMPKPVSRTCPVADVDEHVGGLDVLVNEPASMELTECARQRHSESEKPSDLHGLADEAIERLASCVVDDQHRPPALAHELHRPQCPRAIQVVLELVFVDEAIDALERGMLGAGKDGDESVPVARGTIPPESAEGTSGVLPQHLHRVVFPTSPEQGGCLHLSVTIPVCVSGNAAKAADRPGGENTRKVTASVRYRRPNTRSLDARPVSRHTARGLDLVDHSMTSTS